MNKFKVGDRVRATDGAFFGETGTVIEKTAGTATRVKFDHGTQMFKITDFLELIKDEPAPSAKDNKVTFKLTGAEAFVESAKQLIEVLEALEVEIDDGRDTDPDTD